MLDTSLQEYATPEFLAHAFPQVDFNIQEKAISPYFVIGMMYLIEKRIKSKFSFQCTAVEEFSIDQTKNNSLNIVFVPSVDSIDTPQGYLLQKIATDYVGNCCPAKIFISKKNRSTICFISPRSIVAQVLLGCISLLLPWYFNGDKVLTEDEKRLLLDIFPSDTGNLDNANKILMDFMSVYDLKSWKEHNIISEFSHSGFNRRINLLERTIYEDNQTANNLYHRLLDMNNKIRDNQTALACYRLPGAAASEDLTQELEEFVKSQKCLHVYRLDKDDLGIMYTVVTPMTTFDIEMLNKLIDNADSFLYTYAHADEEYEKTKALWEAIANGDFLLYLTGSYKITIDNCNPHSDFDVVEPDTMPHCHSIDYECLGSNRAPIASAIKEGNYINCIAQTIYAAQEVNFADAAPIELVRHMFYDERYEDSKCIQLPDGSRVTVAEAMEWLDNQEES